jgi:hypothetical protein
MATQAAVMSAKATKVRTRAAALAAGVPNFRRCRFFPTREFNAVRPKPSGTCDGAGAGASDRVRRRVSPGMFHSRLREMDQAVTGASTSRTAPPRGVSA